MTTPVNTPTITPAASALPPVNHTAVLKIAIPIMLSNVTEPLIGVVNTAVIGQLPQAHYIGGVAVGSLIFSFLFWGFGFLRLSTGGLSAQATGAGDNAALAAVFWRSLIIGAVVGIALLLLSPIIRPSAISLMGGSAEVQSAASTYFSWRILSAPAALANFAILGWFVGQGRATIAFITQLFLNLTNMGLSALLVLHFHMAMDGVGVAVLVAEYAAVALGLVLVLRRLRQLGQGFNRARVLDAASFRKVIVANADIMIRTLCLLFAFAWFTARGARAGDIAVASNSVLLHLFEVTAYLIDGFAYAAEALVGQSIGAGDKARYRRAISISSLWAMVYGALASLVLLLAGPAFIDVMTVNADVREMARIYLPWAAATPLLGAACFLYDGIFTGAMATRDMRNMMLVSLAVYLGATILLEPQLGNHGLWAGLCIFLFTRSVTFAARLPAIQKKAFGQAA